MTPITDHVETLIDFFFLRTEAWPRPDSGHRPYGNLNEFFRIRDYLYKECLSGKDFMFESVIHGIVVNKPFGQGTGNLASVVPTIHI